MTAILQQHNSWHDKLQRCNSWHNKLQFVKKDGLTNFSLLSLKKNNNLKIVKPGVKPGGLTVFRPLSNNKLKFVKPRNSKLKFVKPRNSKLKFVKPEYKK